MTLPLTLLVQAAASAAAIAPAVAAPALLPRLGVGPVAVGLYVAVLYGAAMLSSQWGAAMVRRWGPIRTSQVALVLAAVGVLLVAVPHVGIALLGAALVGAGYGPITPSSSEILARTTPPERYALVFSLKQTGVPVGGVVAGLIVPGLVHAGGPIAAHAAIAALCLAAAALAARLRRALDRLRDPLAPLPRLARLLAPIRFVMAHGILFRLAMCSLVFSAVQVCITSYTVTLLTRDLRWTLVAAGAALAVAQVAGVVGRVLWGVVADRRQEARTVLIGLALAMIACSFAMPLFDAGSAHLGVIALLAAYGATGIGWNGVFLATIARVVPVEQATAATSGSLFFTYFGVVVGPPLFGAAGAAFGRLDIAFALLSLPLAWTVFVLWRWSSSVAPPAGGESMPPS
ncbi:MAG: MFS transporter [Caldimonas sp.]